MPVDPSVSRRFSIFTRVCSALSSSLSKPTSSFKTSSLVVLCSCRLIASSAKNSRKRTSSRSGRTAAKRNGWLLVAQRVITLCLMHFPYQTGQTFPLFLAPMSGVSESPFRLLCRRFGADVVVSEFISAVGVAPGLQHLFDDMRVEEAERPLRVQLYCADATVMARAAQMVTEAGRPDFIDINFRSEEHTSELQSQSNLVCRLLLEKKKKYK